MYLATELEKTNSNSYKVSISVYETLTSLGKHHARQREHQLKNAKECLLLDSFVTFILEKALLGIK